MPTWREKLKAHGEVSREGLDPYKQAGAAVYDYILQLDDLRRRADAEPNLRITLASGWIAFALQVLGDEMLDADAAADPSTAHYVPAVTAEQVTAFYEPVPAWMSRARAAEVNPAFRLDVTMPEVLPDWVEVEPCPPAHLAALRSAADRLRGYTDSVMAGFDPAAHEPHAHQIIAQGVAEAASLTEYANGLWGAAGSAPPAAMHEAIEANLKHAAESYFYLGQVVAMPSLADAPKRVREEQPDAPRRSFLDTILQSYPQVAQRRRSGQSSGFAGGLLGGILAGEVIDGIFGGGGFGGGGFGGGGFGGGGFGGGGFGGGGIL